LQECVDQHEQVFGDIPEELPVELGQIRRLDKGWSG
jgi:hypothetical protein